MESLTGDPELDRLVPVAVRLTCGLREWNPEEVAQAFADAAQVAPRGSDPTMALAMVCAAMVPWDRPPSELLAWVAHHLEYERLRALGLDRSTAATLVDQMPATRRKIKYYFEGG